MQPGGARDVLVIGGNLAGASAALAAVRSGARVRLLLSGAQGPGDALPIPADPTALAAAAQDRARRAGPEDLQVFRFRARRVTRWLNELGIPHDAAWATELWKAVVTRCEREGVAVDETSIAVRLVSGPRGAAGAVVVDGATCTVHRADTTILAGGGAAYLWPSARTRDPASGIALAVRAGLALGDLGQVAWTAGSPLRFVDALRGDGRGQVGVAGVAACGEVLSVPWHAVPELTLLEDVVRGLEAGAFHPGPPGRADAEMVPVVDEAMPPGFASMKLERLRAVLTRRARADATADDLARAEAELLSLRGEFADYARARVATDVHVLHQAADVALAHVASRLRPAPASPDVRTR